MATQISNYEIASFFRAFAESTQQAAKSVAKIRAEKLELFKKSPSSVEEMNEFLKLNKQLIIKEGKLISKFGFAIKGGMDQFDRIAKLFDPETSKFDKRALNDFKKSRRLVDKSFQTIRKHINKFFHRLEKEQHLIDADLNLKDRKQKFSEIKNLIQEEKKAEKQLFQNFKKDFTKEQKIARGQNHTDSKIFQIYGHATLNTPTSLPGLMLIINQLTGGNPISVESHQDILIGGVLILAGIGMSLIFNGWRNMHAQIA